MTKRFKTKQSKNINISDKKSEKLIKHRCGKIKFKRIDSAIEMSMGTAEILARKQACICYAEFCKDLEGFECDEFDLVVGVTFNKITEKQIEKHRPDRAERIDLSVMTPYMRLFPINKKMFSTRVLPEDIAQQHLNRRVNYGYSYIAAKKEKNWSEKEYEKHVMNHGYTALAKRGKTIVFDSCGDNVSHNAGTELNNDPDMDELFDGKKQSGTKAAVANAEQSSGLAINYSEEERLSAFYEWLPRLPQLCTAKFENKNFWKQETKNKQRKQHPPVRLAFIIPQRLPNHVGINYVDTGLTEELKKLMMQIGHQELIKSVVDKPKKKKRKR